ncbi:DUF6807 family protein [Zhihengliuella sp.]|uniref:DUF6807 family protein n=1 Tax=Zhihengliuella sp. TaxID=1954483 RepID=UPI0028114B1A|nr:DUF6807 family protein [Zhihengliuella sp.]
MTETQGTEAQAAAPQTAGAPAAGAPTDAPDVVLIGLNGFGRQHLLNIERLVGLGKMRLAAGVDVHDPGPDVRGAATPVFPSLADAVDAGVRPDIVIVSTPIGTHHRIALDALALGADVYVEKPPTATMEQYGDLLAAAQRAGRRVQVGFQAIGSLALQELDRWFAGDGRASPIGRLRAVGASGLWVRTRGYYERSPWAGHRVLDGVQVVDGVVTNPLAHAVMSALHLAGAKTADDVIDLATELHHAHRIEADDTSVVRVTTSSGIPVTCALTVCAETAQDPWITVYGTEGEAVLHYTRDELVVTPNPDLAGGSGVGQAIESGRAIEFGRTDLLENLIDVRTGAAGRLLCPLEETGSFMRVLEAVRTAPDPTPIPTAQVCLEGEGADLHPVVPHIEDYVARAVRAQSGWASLGAPWAGAPASSGTLRITPPGGRSGVEVARLRTGADIAPTNAPRPFLDRVRTLSGIVVTDQQPLDHPWHLGVSVALQDVDGNNFWGGRTYTRADGRYIWRPDHGRIRTVSETVVTEAEAHGACAQRLKARLEWIGAGADGHDGDVLLREDRQVLARPLDDEAAPHLAGPDGARGSGWALDFRYALTAAGERPVSLGSPGSNGRERGGYGGFFWRLPEVSGAEIFTAEAEGEDAVHGSVTDWLAFSADFSSDAVALADVETGQGAATLIFVSTDADPWFVRCSGYPGVGASLAWDAPVLAEPGQPVARGVCVIVADGRLSREAVAALAAQQLASQQPAAQRPAASAVHPAR